jgi:hypothetical protein
VLLNASNRAFEKTDPLPPQSRRRDPDTLSACWIVGHRLPLVGKKKVRLL